LEIKLKSFIKKNLPSRVTEIFFRNKINISKIPNKNDLVISDLFLLRVEKNWKTNFEILNINQTFNGQSDKLKLYYSASDILLAPSILEAFGQVAIEASSCGKPSIGFKNTGLSDAIKHKETGYLAKYLDQSDFDNGLNWIINKLNKNEKYFHKRCLQFVENNFSPNLISKKYIDLYKSIVNGNR